MYYAQIDKNNIVIGISMLSGKVDLQNMIEIEKDDIELLGKKYIFETKKFIDVIELTEK